MKTILLENSVTSVSMDGNKSCFFLACACGQKVFLWKMALNRKTKTTYNEAKLREFYEHFKRYFKLKVSFWFYPQFVIKIILFVKKESSRSRLKSPTF